MHTTTLTREPRLQELRRIHDNQHTAPITSVRWHPNGALLASTSADFTTCLWDAASCKKLRTLKEHFNWVLSCSFAPDRTKVRRGWVGGWVFFFGSWFFLNFNCVCVSVAGDGVV